MQTPKLQTSGVKALESRLRHPRVLILRPCGTEAAAEQRPLLPQTTQARSPFGVGAAAAGIAVALAGHPRSVALAAQQAQPRRPQARSPEEVVVLRPVLLARAVMAA